MEADRRLWKSSAGISTNLIPMSKTTFGTYHYPVNTGRGKATFPTVALGSLHGSLASPMEKVVAYSPRGSLYHKRIYLLYSLVKEQQRLFIRLSKPI